MKNLEKFHTQNLKETENISKLIKSNSVALLISDKEYEFVKGYLVSKNKIICILLDISLSNEFYKKIFVTYKPNHFLSKSKNHYLMIVKKKL